MVGRITHKAQAHKRTLYASPLYVPLCVPGSGHGKHANVKGLHARLAVGAACTLAVFLFEKCQARKEEAWSGDT